MERKSGARLDADELIATAEMVSTTTPERLTGDLRSDELEHGKRILR